MQAAIDSHRSSAAAPNLRGVLLVRAYHRLAHRPRGRGGVWAAVAQSATKGGLKNLTFRAAKTQHAGQPLFPHLSLLALLFPPYYYYYPIAERHPKSRLPTSASTELSRNIHRRLFNPNTAITLHHLHLVRPFGQVSLSSACFRCPLSPAVAFNH